MASKPIRQRIQTNTELLLSTEIPEIPAQGYFPFQEGPAWHPSDPPGCCFLLNKACLNYWALLNSMNVLIIQELCLGWYLHIKTWNLPKDITSLPLLNHLRTGPALTEEPLDQDRTELAARSCGSLFRVHVAVADLFIVRYGSAEVQAGDCPRLRGTGRQRQTEIHLWSAASKVKGHDKALASIPAEAADIWFCTQQRHPGNPTPPVTFSSHRLRVLSF